MNLTTWFLTALFSRDEVLSPRASRKEPSRWATPALLSLKVWTQPALFFQVTSLPYFFVYGPPRVTKRTVCVCALRRYQWRDCTARSVNVSAFRFASEFPPSVPFTRVAPFTRSASRFSSFPLTLPTNRFLHVLRTLCERPAFIPQLDLMKFSESF